MDNIEIWLTPLLILPGVGLLIMSTSARYSQIHNEVHHLLHEKGDHRPHLANRLFSRSKLFRNALVSLYTSVSVFVLAGLIGGFVAIWETDTYWINALFSFAGILCLLYASIQLIRESILSLDVIEEHFDRLDSLQ